MKYDDVGVAYDWFYPCAGAKRILIAAAAAVSGLLYLWVAAVRAVPGVRRRKAAARRRKVA